MGRADGRETSLFVMSAIVEVEQEKEVLVKPASSAGYSWLLYCIDKSRLAQLVERVTSNDEVSRSSRLVGMLLFRLNIIIFQRLVRFVPSMVYSRVPYNA